MLPRMRLSRCGRTAACTALPPKVAQVLKLLFGSAEWLMCVEPWSQEWLIAAGAYPGFCNMKRLEIFFLSLDGMLVHRRSLPLNLLGFPNNSTVPIYTPGWREALWEWKTQHNVPGQGSSLTYIDIEFSTERRIYHSPRRISFEQKHEISAHIQLAHKQWNRVGMAVGKHNFILMRNITFWTNIDSSVTGRRNE